MFYTQLLLYSIWLSEAASHCVFPQQWQGQWYQSGLGDVIISATNFTKKGICLERKKENYLVENIESGCYTCLKIEERHENVLQYKESFCVGKDTLDQICEQIILETLVHVLIREPSVPTACPLDKAFHFTYNNNTGGFCRNPTSYARPCASDALLRLHFKHCPEAAYTHRRDVDLLCLATWRVGPDNFLVGRLTGPGFYTKQESYRCFMYQILGTLVYISMSADASCRGLRNTRDGPVVMEFSQDMFGWPAPACTFPPWIAKTLWRDLSGKHFFKPNTKGDQIRMLFKTYLAASEMDIHKTYRCVRVLHHNVTASKFAAVSFSSHGCTSKYQCVRFLKRKEGIIEIHEGKYSEYASDACSVAYMNNATNRLLLAENSQGRRCPYPGRYVIHTGIRNCLSSFRSGCNGSNVIDISSSCSPKKFLRLECLKTWKENKRRYLVVRKLDDPSGAANCFSLVRRGHIMKFSIEPSCNIDAPYIVRNMVNYVFDSKTLTCDLKNNSGKTVESENQNKEVENKDFTSYGGSYKHVDDVRRSREHRTSSENKATNFSSCLPHVLSVLYCLKMFHGILAKR